MLSGRVSRGWRDHGRVRVQRAEDDRPGEVPGAQVPLHQQRLLPVQCEALHQARRRLWSSGEFIIIFFFIIIVDMFLIIICFSRQSVRMVSIWSERSVKWLRLTRVTTPTTLRTLQRLSRSTLVCMSMKLRILMKMLHLTTSWTSMWYVCLKYWE